MTTLLNVLGLTLAIGGPAEPALEPLALDRAIGTALHALPLADTRPATEPSVPAYEASISVTGWAQEELLIPDYAQHFKPPPGVGVTRGGQSGSPSFDELTRTYWWE